jgi:DNA-binding LytR/AlgR family response regulator
MLFIPLKIKGRPVKTLKLKTFIEMMKNSNYNYSYSKQPEGDESMRIAICDDEQICRTNLRNSLVSSVILPPGTEITECADGVALLSIHTKLPFNIIFLDIQMEGMSGLEVGHKIRDVDKNVIIIFLTGYQQYVFQSFKIEAFDFIMKPIDDSTLEIVLERALRKHKEQHCVVKFKNLDGSCIALDVSEIVCIEGGDSHRIKIISNNAFFYCNATLNEYSNLLSPYGFLRCQRNYLVNMSHIRRIENTQILTKSNRNIPMSVRKKQDCLKAFNEFLAKYKV